MSGSFSFDPPDQTEQESIGNQATPSYATQNADSHSEHFADNTETNSLLQKSGVSGSWCSKHEPLQSSPILHKTKGSLQGYSLSIDAARYFSQQETMPTPVRLPVDDDMGQSPMDSHMTSIFSKSSPPISQYMGTSCSNRPPSPPFPRVYMNMRHNAYFSGLEDDIPAARSYWNRLMLSAKPKMPKVSTCRGYADGYDHVRHLDDIDNLENADNLIDRLDLTRSCDPLPAFVTNPRAKIKIDTRLKNSTESIDMTRNNFQSTVSMADVTRSFLEQPNYDAECLQSEPTSESSPESIRQQYPSFDSFQSVDIENKNSVKVRLKRAGYFTKPALNSLKLDKNGHCYVTDFLVGRRGYGSVKFLGLLDIQGLDLDNLVSIHQNEITVYPDDAANVRGQGLNRRAEVSLHGIYPRDSAGNNITNPDELIRMNFAAKVERYTESINAEFLDYDELTGSWVFCVKRCYRYMFLADDSDD